MSTAEIVCFHLVWIVSNYVNCVRADLTLTYKILFGLIDIDPDSTPFFNIYNGPPLLGHIYRLRCNTQRLNTGLHLFSSRVIAAWIHCLVPVL